MDAPQPCEPRSRRPHPGCTGQVGRRRCDPVPGSDGRHGERLRPKPSGLAFPIARVEFTKMVIALSAVGSTAERMFATGCGWMIGTRKLSINGLGGDQWRSPRRGLRDNVVENLFGGITSGLPVIRAQRSLEKVTFWFAEHLACKVGFPSQSSGFSG